MIKLSDLHLVDLLSTIRQEALRSTYRLPSEELSLAIKELRRRGFVATIYVEIKLAHAYPEESVEVQRWKGGRLLGVGAKTQRELMSSIYFSLEDRLLEAESYGDIKLASYYVDGLMKLIQVWKPLRISNKDRQLWFEASSLVKESDDNQHQQNQGFSAVQAEGIQ